jgi:hypothetical protein
MLARDGKIIADDDAKVTFERDRVAITGKPVADVTRYTYRDAGTRYGRAVRARENHSASLSYRPGVVPGRL